MPISPANPSASTLQPRTLSSEIVAQTENVAAHLINDLKEDAGSLRDGFLNVAGEAVGQLEMLGLRYPVHEYSSKVDAGLTRGSRLSDAEMEGLHQQGFKSTVNLCAENNDDAPRTSKLGMSSLRLPIIDNTAPSESQMKQFLDFATNPVNRPCYVHCEAGVGRTGTAVACYRMAVQGWTAEQAIADAKKFHFPIPEQEAFLRKFGADLAAGRIAGYPLPAGQVPSAPCPVAARPAQAAALWDLKEVK